MSARPEPGVAVFYRADGTVQTWGELSPEQQRRIEAFRAQRSPDEAVRIAMARAARGGERR